MKNKKSNIANNLEEIDSLINEKVYGIPPHASSDIDIAEAVQRGFWANRPSFKQGEPGLQKYKWNKKDYELSYTDSKFNYGGDTGNNGYGLWFWHERFGKEYQEDIEAHVKSWERPIPKYSSNMSLAWAAAEKVDIFRTIMLKKNCLGSPRWYTIHKKTKKSVSMGYTAEEALCRACLVIKAKENEQTHLSNQRSLIKLSKARSSR